MVKSTYVSAEAEKILNDPLYAGKKYHYFEKDGIFYIDQTVAKQEDFIPYNFVAFEYTYRYDDSNYYSFNYTIVDDTHINYEVFIYDLVEQKFVKSLSTAVLEDGEWKLEKIGMHENIEDVVY